MNAGIAVEPEGFVSAEDFPEEMKSSAETQGLQLIIECHACAMCVWPSRVPV